MATTIERVSAPGARFWLDDWLVEPSLNRISRGGAAVQVERKVMDLLVYLAGRAGEVVDKREIQDAVWQTEFVSYNTVAGRVSELREALDDHAREPRYLETVHGRGYRLIAEVRHNAGPDADAAVLAAGPQEGSDERPPYPGLASFTEADAGDFFGREAEIAALWRKITSRRLLAVIGASGAGKSSLVRAGVVARAPPGWRAVVCKPGEDPLLAVARALAPDLMGDAEEMRRLLAFHDPDMALAVAARWRGRWDEALLVVDQFEELFTLNPEPVRARFAELLRRLVDAAGIHVVLALRDDFLLACHHHPQLEPIFSDLTPVGPPSGKELRRALIEPAARRLYGFESEGLVDEMVGEVKAERGALPLLAFAVSRLWELRNREERLLTREAYERIGGVGGALAQHAEATLEAIGLDRLPLVREIFRNLVTAQGTRAVRDVDELLSVFADSRRESAREVLRALVDARLLTSFEDKAAEEAERGTRHRVEIVHESLLASWPRLVRWQTQDADAAQLRDQLRQAAHLWEQRGRPDDLLWTGTSYQEYQVWRSRYPGGLTDLEEAFGRSMKGLADRRRRRRRQAVTAAIAVLVAVAAALSLLWLRSARETRRAESRKLIALGRVELDRNPSAALALARASLEAVDSLEARMLAVEALWAGPPMMLVEPRGVDCLRAAFSPDGRKLACSGFNGVLTVFRDDRAERLEITDVPVMTDLRGAAFTPASDRLLTWLPGDRRIRIFSPEGVEVDALPGEAQALLVLDDHTVATYGAFVAGDTERAVRVWSLRDHSSTLVARWQPPSGYRVDLVGPRPAALDPRLRFLAHGDDRAVHLLGLAGPDAGRELELGSHDAKVREVAFAPDGTRLASIDEEGGLHVWPLATGEPVRTLVAQAPTAISALSFDVSGSRLGWASDGGGTLVWSLADPPDAAPRLLLGSADQTWGAVAFDPGGRWAAAGRISGQLFLWSLASPYPRALEGHTQRPLDVAFTGDSRFLASCGFDGVRLWPLSPEGGRQRLVDLGVDYWCFDIAADSTTDTLLVAAAGTGAFLVRPDGAPPRKLEAIPPSILMASAIDTRAGLAAVAPHYASESKDKAIFIADLRSGETRSVSLLQGETRNPWEGGVDTLAFAADGTLLSGRVDGVERWNLVTGKRTRICGEAGRGSNGRYSQVAVSASGRSMIAGCWDGQITTLLVGDSSSGTALSRITSHGDAISAVGMDPAGELIATGDSSGAVRVGRATGEEPHLLLGHSDLVLAVAFSPDGRWIASASGDEIFLWPMPDLSKPPLHSLPHDELIAKLGTLTNLHAVRDAASDTGWTIAFDPFPGWRDVPTW
jgi:WD40 repeat protein/DNA-binding winged helix-turn-helix (wHTH) protein